MEKEPDIPATFDQRTTFLVNTFVIHTVRLLNNVAVACENKLADVHRRIQRVDATLSLLETKLRSVEQGGTREQPDPGVQPASPAPPPPPAPPAPLARTSSEMSVSPEPDQGTEAAVTSAGHQAGFISVKDDPMYARFFRMLHVGVPLPAVKRQMALEGLDGSVLDNPEMPSSEA